MMCVRSAPRLTLDHFVVSCGVEERSDAILTLSETHSGSLILPSTTSRHVTCLTKIPHSHALTTMAAYFFSQPVDIDIKLENEEGRKIVDAKVDKERTQSCPVYYDGESVAGSVSCEAQHLAWPSI